VFLVDRLGSSSSSSSSDESLKSDDEELKEKQDTFIYLFSSIKDLTRGLLKLGLKIAVPNCLLENPR
jgi:hypothetical protein